MSRLTFGLIASAARKVLLGCALLVGMSLGGAILLYLTSPTLITVRNHSGQPITDISVRVQGKTLGFSNLPTGNQERRWFLNSGADGHPLLEARSSDGKTIQRAGGYITSGSLSGAIEFTITPQLDVELVEEYWP